MRRLIINADDFGLTTGVNRAITECMDRGVVTSTTIMATSSRFNDAAAIAREHAANLQRSFGCHVLLVDGTPISPADAIPSLTKNGALRRSLADFAKASLTGKIVDSEVEAEATAQFRALQSAGVSISHFDAHKHAHMFPGVLRPLLRAASNCGIRAVRSPFEARNPLPYEFLVKRRDLWKRFFQVRTLARFRDSFVQLVAEHGLAAPQGSLGVLVTGAIDEQIFEMLISSMPQGTWELVCHPGYNDEELASAGTRLLKSRAKELEILTSAFARDVLARGDIELISFHQLANA